MPELGIVLLHPETCFLIVTSAPGRALAMGDGQGNAEKHDVAEQGGERSTHESKLMLSSPDDTGNCDGSFAI